MFSPLPACPLVLMCEIKDKIKEGWIIYRRISAPHIDLCQLLSIINPTESPHTSSSSHTGALSLLLHFVNSCTAWHSWLWASLLSPSCSSSFTWMPCFLSPGSMTAWHRERLLFYHAAQNPWSISKGLLFRSCRVWALMFPAQVWNKSVCPSSSVVASTSGFWLRPQ